MTRRLLIFLGQSLHAPINWGVVDELRLVEHRRLDDASLIGDLISVVDKVDQTIAILPGEQACLQHMAAPPKSSAKFKAAVSLLLEDQLSEPIEKMHIVTQSLAKNSLSAHGLSKNSDGAPSGRALGVSKTLMDEWRKAFEEASLTPDLFTVDTAIMVGVDGVVVLRDGARTLLAANDVAYACENALFDQLEHPALTPPAGRTRAFIGESEGAPAYLSGDDFEWLGPLSEQQRFEFFARKIDASTPINLLQGAYRVQRALNIDLSPWRRSGVIAACLVGMIIASMVAEAWQHDRVRARWIKLTQTLHTETFPEAASTDPVTHARRVLGQGADNVSYLATIGQFANAADGQDGFEIERISFDRNRGRFSVSVRSKTDAAIEGFRETLAERGVVVRDNGGYRRSKGQWVSELLADVK